MYLAIREMKFAKARYLLISTIMVLVAFLVLFVTGLAQGLAYDNAASIKNMDATHFILEQDSNHRFTRSAVNESQLQIAASIVGEQNAESIGLKMATVVPDGMTAKIDVAFFAVDPEGWLAPSKPSEPLFAAPKNKSVFVDRKMLKHGVEIGTLLRDQQTGIELTVEGFVQNESFSHAPVVFVSGEAWAELQALTQSGQDHSGSNGLTYNAIAVKEVNENADALKGALPGTELIAKSDAVSAIPGYREEQGSLLMMIGFLFVISAFVLAVFFYVITIQKTSQFGILKAIGAENAYLAKSVASQVLLLSLSSLVVSVLLVRLFESALPDSMPFLLELPTLLLTCLAFLAMSLAGSLLSVWKVAKIDALDAIGRTAA